MHRMMTLCAFVLFTSVAVSLSAAATESRDFNIFLSGGKSQPNWHGQSAFRSITFEVAGQPPNILQRLHATTAGVALTYSDVRQPQSWFGNTYGDPDQWVRAESAFFFVRRLWRSESEVRPFVDFGTGPMWSNRRIPAATSKLNFDTQLGFGMTLPMGRHPLMIGYRYSHISNGMLTHRNPGLNVHTVLIGTRFARLR